MHKYWGLLLAFWGLMSSTAFSQNYHFQQYSLDEGLPQSEVQDIIQDSRGIIWAGTNGGGLCRFDGKKFEVFTRKQGLISNQINQIFEDSKGNLWISSQQGITFYDGIRFNIVSFDSINSQLYLSFCEDKKGNIYFLGAYSGGIVKIHYFDGKNYRVLTDEQELLKNHRNNIGIFGTLSGKILIRAGRVLYEYDGTELSLSAFQTLPQLKDKTLRPFFEEKNGKLWLLATQSDGTAEYITILKDSVTRVKLPSEINANATGPVFVDSRGQAWIYYGINNSLYKYSGPDDYQVFNTSNGLLPGFILTITEDSEGNIWIGTSGSGMMKYSGTKFISYTTSHGLGDNMVRSIYQDSRGVYWFGTTTGGLTRYDGRQFTNLQNIESQPIGMITGLEEDKNHDILCSSLNGLWRYNGRNFQNVGNDYGISNNQGPLTDVLEDEDKIWIGSNGAGLYQYSYALKTTRNFSTASRELINDFISHIFKDSKGNYWIGTYGGITLIQPDTIINYTTSQRLSHRIILQLTEDFSGFIWAATYGGGLSRIKLMEDDSIAVQVIDTDHGLSSDNVYSVIVDREGNVWAGCQNGVDKISFDKNGNITAIKNFDKYEGFTGIENNGKANLVDRAGRLWFGTIKGLMVYNPEAETFNSVPPETNIKNIKLFYKNVRWSDKEYSRFYDKILPWSGIPQNLKLPYNRNHVAFEFEGLSFKVPEKVQFQWMLEGVDEEWSPVSVQNEVIYANLTPGYYSFLVKARNNDGVWNEQPAAFNFRILPPFWATWWFRGLAVGFIGTIIIIGIWLRNKFTREKQQELEQLVAFKTKKLEEQKEEIMAQRDKLKKSYDNLDYLSKIGRDITANLTIDAIVESVYDRLNNLMDASVFGLGIYNPENRLINFPILLNSGIRVESVSMSIDDRTNFASLCLKDKKEIIIDNFAEDHGNLFSEIITPYKDGNSPLSLIFIPLINNEKPLGVITVQSYRQNAFRDYHLNIIRNLAIYANIAMENAQAYEKIQEQKNQLTRANENILKQKNEIENKNRELLDLNNEKSQIISIVAHDLRNPLTSALTLNSLIQSELKNLSEDQLQYVKTIERSLLRMNEMIVRLLDIRKLEERKLELRMEMVNLEKVLQDVNRNFKSESDRKKIKIEIESQELFARIDEDYATQVFENLISNAIKFSPPEKKVHIKLYKENGKARAEIRDEGPGLTKEDMKKIFGKFQKLSAQPTGGEHSTGLGLSIVKKYVEAMDGKVWCESEPGNGASFIVEFNRID